MRSDDFGDDYAAALAYRGHTKLAEHAVTHSFDVEINAHGNLIYKTDFDLGDIVTVQARPWGVSLQTRITEITESYDESGLSIDCVFGCGALTLSQRLKGVG